MRRQRSQRAEAQLQDTKGTTVETVKVQENRKHRTLEDKRMVRTKCAERGSDGRSSCRALVRKEGWPVTRDEGNMREINSLVDKVCEEKAKANGDEAAEHRLRMQDWRDQVTPS